MSKNKKAPEEANMDMGGGISVEDSMPNDWPDDWPQGMHPSDGPSSPNATPEPESAGIVDHDINRPAFDLLLDDDKQKQWLEKPSYADQYARFPETVRPVGPTFRVFDMSQEADIQQMNALMAGMQNPNCPRSHVAVEDKQWDDKAANWKVLAKVTHFLYLKIIEKD